MFQCPNCGEMLEDNMKFCTRCGEVIRNKAGGMQPPPVVLSKQGGQGTAEGNAQPGMSAGSGQYGQGNAQPQGMPGNMQNPYGQPPYGQQGAGSGSGQSGQPGMPSGSGQYGQGNAQPQGMPGNMQNPYGQPPYGQQGAGAGEGQPGPQGMAGFGNPYGQGMGQPGMPGPGSPYGPGPGPERKRLGTAQIALIAAACVVAAGIVLCLLLNAAGFFKSDKQRFLETQSDFFSSRMITPVSDAVSTYESGLSTDLTISASASSSLVGEEAAQILQDVAFVAKMDTTGKEKLYNLILQLKGSNLLNVQFSYDGETISLAIPELNGNVYTGKYAKILRAMGMEDAAKLDGEELKKLYPSAALQKTLSTRYGKILLKLFTKDNLQVKSQDVELPYLKESGKYKLYRFTPTKEDIVTVLNELADTVEKDKDLDDWAKSMAEVLSAMEDAGYGNYDTDSAREFLEGGFGEIAEELRKNADAFAGEIAKSGFTWELALESGTIRMIRFGTPEAQFVYECYTDSKKETHEAYYFTEDWSGNADVAVENDYSLESGTYKGLLRLISASGTLACRYEASQKNRSVLGIPYGSYDLSAEGVSCTLEVKNASDGDDHSLSLFYDNEKLSVNVNASKKGSAAKPSGTKVDISDYDESDYLTLLGDLSEDAENFLSENPELYEYAGAF